MEIDYCLNEAVEFFESLLVVNGYWDFLAEKFYNRKLMNHPYKDEVLSYFEQFKNHNVFNSLDNVCKKLKDFSILIQFPTMMSIQDGKFFFMENSDSTYKDDISILRNLLSELEDLYRTSDYKSFFEKLHTETLLPSKENQEIILKTLLNEEKYLGKTIPNITIYSSPLILGNFFIPLKNGKISLVISPYDYNETYEWGRPEDYVLQEVIMFYSLPAISRIKDQLNSHRDDFICNIPYYSGSVSIVSAMFRKMTLIRYRSLFLKDDENKLLRNESNNFPDISKFYNKMVAMENNQTLNLDKIQSIFLE